MNAEFQLWAAVDLMSGKAVRLRQGRGDSAWVVSEDPVGLALAWQEAGVWGVHVVDLDAALGQGENRQLVRQLCGRLRVPVQVGGGVRSLQAYWELREAGAARVILGTLAVRQPEVVQQLAAADGDGLVVAADLREGWVLVEGWKQGSGELGETFARRMRQYGCRHLLVTAVARDGMDLGPDLPLLRSLLAAFGPGILAAGGIRNQEDLTALRALAGEGLAGAVVGTALAKGSLSLRERAHGD
ncbi:MAG: 1-(5-phosphoribosyl)-5-[(5-phosphoribosylamino)methylideneamino] imidazole-4-carboxamide isomerase [Thermoanaerobaculum sp.]|nr:1-(5-phosphoribosyl)-5-[(5-phosphoribosylamino)methylideneamino] imidazole-4-carboxamide isomerase [Thermoanaerobaculum sp.]MDW7968240.1 1-(5-phosphoribosyl)-5-[(5-phosphoribosylamino)methylideneamino] imidazole-4-carboxamide isomerase [Thermoanaerobaculum sp.]